MKKVFIALGVLIFFVAGAIAYTWPAVVPIWEQRTDQFMSDGSDPTTSPFQFEMLHRNYLEQPLLFFYGAFPNRQFNAPEGFVAWYSTIEKVAGAFFPFFIPAEQTSALLAMILMVLNGLCFYGMSRSLGWRRDISIALAFAWSFSTFTRARAQVHPSLVGIYAIPLAVWGLHLLIKSCSPKNITLAAFCFLGCATSPHYYLIFLGLFSPFFLLFYFCFPQSRQHWARSLGALMVAVVPAALFLGTAILKPVPAEFQKNTANVFPVTGKSPSWPHPFLTVFSAQPRDYFAGDFAIGQHEWNPLREKIDLSIRKDPSIGNFHEHAVALRWVIWIAFILGLLFLIRNRKLVSLKTAEGSTIVLFLVWGTFSFLSSLAPDWGFMWGPSAWVHAAVEQIRVPSRLAIFMQFSVLMCLGFISRIWLARTELSARKISGLVGTFGILLVLDLPPFINPLPISPIVPSKSSLIEKKSGVCGLGMRFPHISASQYSLDFYYLIQSLRGTDCSILNPATENLRDYKMTLKFGYPNSHMLDQIANNDSSLKKDLIQFARCTQLDWIIFDPRVPPAFSLDFCILWGGEWMGKDLCRNKLPAAIVAMGRPDECITP